MSAASASPTAENEQQDNPQAQAVMRDKRRIKELEDELERFRSAPNSRRASTATVINKGRAFRRVVSLFDNPSDLVREYDRRLALADEGLDDANDPSPHSPGHNRLFYGFQEFMEFMPWVRAKLTDLDPNELEELFKELRKGADGARGDDASSLKQVVVTWLGNLFPTIEPPISPTLKWDRGLEHDATGALLRPIEYNWDDLEVRRKIRERHPEFLVTAESWPAFLFEVGHVNNPENIENGLFRSTLLLKTFKLIFTSPTSAQEVTVGDDASTGPPSKRSRSSSEKATRSHVASLIGMRSVKPRAIAYAAVQLRFTLSSLSSWRIFDGDFDANAFYQNVVEYFEATPGPVAKAKVQALLLWWDRKVFGRNHEILRTPEQAGSLTVARLAAQRAAAEQV
ncbi:hypothetical protein HYDPIDRAFT_119690 [Hydnomerulius pinastri MD-312]|uniref:Uncharacterized protein n=1 Tax=Hydnomerulius pinastri MD-312 TaxID=994086 RepID=A0A0C9W6E3_9AGAM|nr:hypothetical protein HYDPIDRAFT_119690 [Hydnomerulius pinastri MD-312]